VTHTHEYLYSSLMLYKRVRVQLVWSSGSRANLLSRLLDPIVFLSMNNPPQVSSSWNVSHAFLDSDKSV
jgi:hypothetical protein